MIRSALVRPAAIACFLLASACKKHEFLPPDRDRQVARADSMFAEVSFDTITWPDDSVRALYGNVTYASVCRRCHGTLGEGRTEYAHSRGLHVPSLVEADWYLADDIPGIRHNIFVGHAGGMPTFGVANLGLREIDAVAWYVARVLRPDVLGDSTSRLR